MKIIHYSVYYKVEKYIDNTQFGFRKGLGKRKAMFVNNILKQRCPDVKIDYNKACDKVRHEQPIQLLEDKNPTNNHQSLL